MLKIIRKLAAEHLLSIERKPQTLKDLDFVFADQNGIRYYSWPDLTQMPKNRYTKLESFTMWADARISPATLQEITDAIQQVNHEISVEKDNEKRRKLHGSITYLTEEIVRRMKYAIPPEVLINIAALLVVREDESPDNFNEKIQDEKYTTFTEAKNAGHTFFLDFPIFNSLHRQLIGIEGPLTQLLSKWEQDTQQQKEVLNAISSYTKSKPTNEKKEN